MSLSFQQAPGDAVECLRRGVAFYDEYVDDLGECRDPVVGAPFQYSTAYHAYLRAALAKLGPADERKRQIELAKRGLAAALRHVADSSEPPHISHLNAETGACGRLNHRDFFWPPILKTYRLLKDLGEPGMEKVAEKITSVDPDDSFNVRAPGNWAMVWLNGEWMRIREGLGGMARDAFEREIAVFFERNLSVEGGFYQEEGHPNSYDLFTRYFLADLLERGWDGPWAAKGRVLLGSGLQRSLGLQLSDGSLASGYRSTGQTWTDGVQIAFFSLAARLLAATDPESAERARFAADRAYASLIRFFRPDGSFSPVQNCLPAAARVGYEGYTADASYANLALAFLADAVLAGYRPRALDKSEERPLRVFVEEAPFFRASMHRGPYSVQLNAFPHPRYDALGLVDVTFGPGRILHWNGSVKPIGRERCLNPGMASCPKDSKGNKPGPGSDLNHGAPLGFEPCPDEGWLRMRIQPRVGIDPFEITVEMHERGVRVAERSGDNLTPKDFLLPYLRDAGTGETTRVEVLRADGRGFLARFSLADEVIEVGLDEAVESIRHLPWHFSGRRGYYGLIRVNLRTAAPGIHYHFRIIQ